MRWDPDSEQWIDDEEIDYSTRPDLAPPNSVWNPESGGWDNTGFDPGPPWGGGPISDILETYPKTPTPNDTPTPPPPPPPKPPVPPNFPGGGGGGRVPGTTEYPIAGGKKFFEYPDFVPPNIEFKDWQAPSWDVAPFDYPDFDYAEFEGPTAENFKTDPGYDFREKQMLRAITNQKSAQGLLATGGTLTDLMSYAGGLASQEFGNVWNRDFTKHNANKDAAFGEWQANRGNQSDIWGKNYQGESDEFTRELTNYLTQEEKKGQDWTRAAQTYATNLGKESAAYGLNLDTSQLNLARDNSQFSNLLSLYGIMTRNMPTYSPSV